MKTGFVKFPTDLPCITDKKMWINIVAFDILNARDKTFSEYADTHLYLDGDFISDDLLNKPTHNKVFEQTSIDELLKVELDNQIYEQLYFPNINCEYIHDYDSSKWISTPLLNSTLVGWSDKTYIFNDNIWHCSYNDLTDDGKEMYHLFKKLYNTKEVRILTFCQKEIF